jgi:hypothetical protein
MLKQLMLLLVAYILVVVLFPIVVVVTILYKIYNKSDNDIYSKISKYLNVCAIGLDQAGGAAIYEKENYTISSYTYFLCKTGSSNSCMFSSVIDFIFGKNHCMNSYIWEIDADKKDYSVFTTSSDTIIDKI